MDSAEAQAVIDSLNRQILAVLMVLPPQLGPEPLPCPVCGMGRLACGMIFGRHREDEPQVRAFLARWPVRPGPCDDGPDCG